MVRTAKDSLRRLVGEWQAHVVEFLLYQHITPCTAIGRSPAELLISCRLTTRLDHLHPDRALDKRSGADTQEHHEGSSRGTQYTQKTMGQASHGYRQGSSVSPSLGLTRCQLKTAWSGGDIQTNFASEPYQQTGREPRHRKNQALHCLKAEPRGTRTQWTSAMSRTAQRNFPATHQRLRSHPSRCYTATLALLPVQNLHHLTNSPRRYHPLDSPSERDTAQPTCKTMCARAHRLGEEGCCVPN